MGRKTRAEPVPKGIPVKIPEPEGWTEYHCLLFFLLLILMGQLVGVDRREGNKF